MSSAEALLQNLPIEHLQASTTNPRRHFDRGALDELVCSIAESGIQTPLLVRVFYNPEKDGKATGYEVVAGERRLRAAQELRLETLPCLVREMTDEEAREVQIIENLQRVGVSPLEEAEAFGELLERLGSITAVAAKLGKAVSYVAKCLRLRSLTLCSADALRGRLITIDHALLLARLAETEQNAALKFTLDRNAGSTVTVEKVVDDRLVVMEKDATGERGYGYRWEPESVVKLKAHIETEGGVKLSRAPWSLTEEDYLLPDVGPCAECPSNTTANTPLFGDLEMGEPTCTDGACFAAKTQGFVQLAQRKAGHDEQAKPKVLVPQLSWKYSGVKPSIVPNEGLHAFSVKSAAETANPAKLLRYGQWIDAKPGSCSNVRPGVTVDWGEPLAHGGRDLCKPGEVVQVCLAVGCKVHPKAWEKQAAQVADKPKASETPAEREARDAAAKAYTESERPVRHAFMRALLAKVMEEREVVLRKMVEDALESCWTVSEEDLALSVGIPFVAAKDADARARDCAAAAAIEKYIGSAMGGELIRLGAAIQHAEVLAISGSGNKGAEREALDAIAKKIGFKWTAPDAVKPAAKKTPAKKAAKPASRTLTAEGRKRIADAMKKRFEERKNAAKAAGKR